MKHIDTLDIYKKALDSGHTEEQALFQAHIASETQDGLYSYIKEYLKEFKQDFASQKLLSILGTIIIVLGGFTLKTVWNLSHDMTEVKSKLEIHSNK